MDEAAFEDVYRATRPRVLGYLLRRTTDPADAADALAETYLVAWRRWDDVLAGDDALPWLLGVARRVLANQSRAERRRDGLDERLRADVTREATTAWIDTDHGETGAAVGRALSRLSARDRELLTLVVWERLERHQVAKVLGCTEAQVRVRLHRARRRLASELAREGITVASHLPSTPLAKEPR